MSCPRCQTPNAEGARFCLTCGAPLPQPPSRAARFFAAFGRALCYYFFFTAIQSVTVVTYQFSLIFREIYPLLLAGQDYTAIYDRIERSVMDSLTQSVHILLILSTAITLLLLSLIFRARRKNAFAEMHLRPTPPTVCGLALLFGLALQVLVSFTLSFLPLPASLVESYNESAAMMQGGPLLIEILNVVIFTPILEEVVFRGLIFTRLSRGMRTVWAVLISAAMFGVAHGHIISFVYAALLGVVFACLMRRRDMSVLPSVFAHAGFNGGSYLVMLLGETPSLPLMLALYLLSIALTLSLGYALFRPAEEPARSEA